MNYEGNAASMRKSHLTETTEWQRRYPTYALGDRDIALAEYDAASSRAETDERGVLVVNGILAAAIAPSLPILAPFIRSFVTAHSNSVNAVDSITNLSIFVASSVFVALIFASYVCHQRRSFVHSARKVIVLRRMLGQSYGATTMVLPNWRLEGADNPFAIHMFPGWSMRTAYPYYALTALTGSLIGYGVYAFLSTAGVATSTFAQTRPVQVYIALMCIVGWSVFFLTYIRRELYDIHENLTLSASKWLAWLLRVRLIAGIQTILYEAVLSRHEAHRLGLDLTRLRTFAVRREDRRFYQHRGVDYRAIARALLSRARGNKAGGGTTITQQLVRTLLIVDLTKRYRRKVIEIPLAYWLNGLLPKNELIEVYLCSVRYDKNVNGVAAALKHFFGTSVTAITVDMAFVLVERISAATSVFRPDGVNSMLVDFLKEGLVSREEAHLILRSYARLLQEGLLSQGKGPTPEQLEESLP